MLYHIVYHGLKKKQTSSALPRWVRSCATATPVSTSGTSGMVTGIGGVDMHWNVRPSGCIQCRRRRRHCRGGWAGKCYRCLARHSRPRLIAPGAVVSARRVSWFRPTIIPTLSKSLATELVWCDECIIKNWGGGYCLATKAKRFSEAETSLNDALPLRNVGQTYWR